MRVLPTRPFSPIVIGRRPNSSCGNPTADDFKAGDFPNGPDLEAFRARLNPVSRAMLDHYLPMSDTDLGAVMRQEFRDRNTGAVGQQMLDRFMRGTGREFPHAPGSVVAELARNTYTFQQEDRAVMNALRHEIQTQAGTGTVDFNRVALRLDLPFSTFSLDPTIGQAFRAMIGGVQSVVLWLLDYGQDAHGLPVQVRVRWDIGDNFGVGNGDFYYPELVALWVLQHNRSTHRPFVNRIFIEETAMLDGDRTWYDSLVRLVGR